jgi:glycosyltransferase involved in cell wall biosynthesis
MNDQTTTDAAVRVDLPCRPTRVAVIAHDTESIDGLAQTLCQLRKRTIPGYELDVIGVATFLPATGDRRYDLVHVCEPGPAGLAAIRIADAVNLPSVSSYDADRQGSDATATYALSRVVLSPTCAADRSLQALGVSAERIARWRPGVDFELFNPARYSPDVLPAGFTILYAGRIGRESGTDLLAEAFLIARDHDPRLHLALAGDGPDEERLRARLGRAATFLGRPGSEHLASVYASAELLVVPSSTDACGPIILQAQASGLPILAVDGGASAELIENGRSGCLVPGEPRALASAIRGLARRDTLRDRLATGGLMAVRGRSWEHSLSELASGYAHALSTTAARSEVARAA